MNKRLGNQSVIFSDPPYILAGKTIVGKTEGQGPLGRQFDTVLEDDLWEQKTWEQAERKMYEQSVRSSIQASALQPEQVQLLLGGDLLNQIISANFAARALGIPFLGLYGACSNMSEALLIGSMLLDGGFVENAVCATCSHFSTAERQYRTPLELGTQRTPSAQRTVTGAGATTLCVRREDAEKAGMLPCLRITGGTIGKVVDMGVTDANNMGAAMAPAAVDTIAMHLSDTRQDPERFDLFITGDLGTLGLELTKELLMEKGFDLAGRIIDCGCEIYDRDKQDVDAGGSGCGCSAIVLNAHILPNMRKGAYQKVLFVATGALLSTASALQGESIPGIAHAVVIEREV